MGWEIVNTQYPLRLSGHKNISTQELTLMYAFNHDEAGRSFMRSGKISRTNQISDMARFNAAYCGIWYICLRTFTFPPGGMHKKN
jgi:hypothetical protein